MNKQDIANAIEPQINQAMMIISFSFLMGVIFMYGIGLFVHFTEDPAPLDAFNDGHISRTLAQVTLVFFAISIFLGRFMFRKFSKPGVGTDPGLVVNNLRTGMLVQLAVLEGAAILGAVSFLVGAIDGYTHVNSMMWGTFLPLAYMVFHIILITPPKAYMVRMWEATWHA